MLWASYAVGFIFAEVLMIPILSIHLLMSGMFYFASQKVSERFPKDF